MTKPATTILLANNYHYRRGGADVVYLQQDELLRSVGYDTAHMSMHHPNNEPSRWSEYFVDEIEWGRDYGLIEKLGHASTIIHSRQAYQNTQKVIERSKSRLLHAHNIYHHLSPSILKAAKDAGIPTVFTAHDSKVLCPAYSMMSHGKVCEACKSNRVHNVVLKRCMKGSLALSGLIAVESATHRLTGAYRNHVDRFVCPSHFLINKFVEWGWPKERFSYVPNCVEVDQFTVADTVGKRFLFVGRLGVGKGLDTLIRATAHAGVGLDIVGTGPLDEELQKLAGELSADVVFHGFQKGDALWTHVRACRALVLSAESYENAPISIIEGYSCGKPLIVTDIGGMPEMIKPGETGLIVPPGQYEQLAGAMQRVAQMSDDAVRDMGMAGRAVAEQDYSAKRHLDLLNELYESLGVVR